MPNLENVPTTLWGLFAFIVVTMLGWLGAMIRRGAKHQDTFIESIVTTQKEIVATQKSISHSLNENLKEISAHMEVTNEIMKLIRDRLLDVALRPPSNRNDIK